jgi:hypothetical protein
MIPLPPLPPRKVKPKTKAQEKQERAAAMKRRVDAIFEREDEIKRRREGERTGREELKGK